jgi:hypothetical protein
MFFILGFVETFQLIHKLKELIRHGTCIIIGTSVFVEVENFALCFQFLGAEERNYVVFSVFDEDYNFGDDFLS